MRISEHEAKMLGRRAERPTPGPGEFFCVFVPGKLVNTKNVRLHHMALHRYKRDWRDAVAHAALEAGFILRSLPFAQQPKHVSFLACTVKAMDSDGLQMALAPVRDELIHLGLIHGDADADGHVFAYAQTIDRTRRGVEVRVRLNRP